LIIGEGSSPGGTVGIVVGAEYEDPLGPGGNLAAFNSDEFEE